MVLLLAGLFRYTAKHGRTGPSSSLPGTWDLCFSLAGSGKGWTRPRCTPPGSWAFWARCPGLPGWRFPGPCPGPAKPLGFSPVLPTGKGYSPWTLQVQSPPLSLAAVCSLLSLHRRCTSRVPGRDFAPRVVTFIASRTLVRVRSSGGHRAGLSRLQPRLPGNLGDTELAILATATAPLDRSFASRTILRVR